MHFVVTLFAVAFSILDENLIFLIPWLSDASSLHTPFIGWLVAWWLGCLVGNAVFSETAQRIFLIFCMKLGDYKGRKVTEPDFWKRFLICKYSRKNLQISPKSDILILFSKTAVIVFLVFGLKLVLNMTFTLNETYFSEKFAIWTYLTLKLSTKFPKLWFLAIFSTLHH